MRPLALAVCLLACGGWLAAQADRSGTLMGIVTDHTGSPLPGAPIQARHQQSDFVARGASGLDGRYTLAGLPAGTYIVSVTMPCCLFQPFTRPNVTVQERQATQLVIQIEEGNAYGTLGDDPGTLAEMVRRRSTIPARPVPRLADGRPDFSGVWLTTGDPYPEPPAALPWAQAIARERIENGQKDAPHTRCLPGGVPTPASTPPFMAKLVHTPPLLVVLFEDSPGFRQIFFDGRAHPADPDPSWVGHSVGTWDGDALVVDTVGYNDRSWILGAFPHTERLHVVERIRRPDFGRLEVVVTYEDPGTFLEPVVRNMMWELAPGEELLEYVCENNKADRMIGK